MEDGSKLPRLLVTIPAVFVAILPPLADLNDSHLFNSLWPGHARLHTAWLISANSLLSLFVLWTMWRGPRAGTIEGVRTGGTIMAAILGGFMVAAVTKSFYGGTFADANGIQPVGGAIDANLLAFSILFVLLIAAHRVSRPSAS